MKLKINIAFSPRLGNIFPGGFNSEVQQLAALGGVPLTGDSRAK